MLAQENTGAIRGTVQDSTGAAILGAKVTASSPALVRPIDMTSGKDGIYRFPSLPAGIYTIAVSQTGFMTSKNEDINVVLGSELTLDVTLSTGAVNESVNISAGAEAIDVTSSKASTNITEEFIDNTPKGRTFDTLLQVAPGVIFDVKAGRADTSATGTSGSGPGGGVGGYSVNGASGSENVFIIDGVEVSNVRNAALGRESAIPFEFIREVQVKSAGFEAEYGGATGGVINVITKSGSNAFHGQASLEFTSSAYNSRARGFWQRLASDSSKAEFFRQKEDDYRSFFPIFELGGPLVKDRLNFFTAYAPELSYTERSIPFTSGARTSAQRLTRHYGIARLDYAPTQRIQVNTSYIWTPIRVSGLLTGVNPLVAPPTNDLSINGGFTPANAYTASFTYAPTSKLLLSARYGHKYLNDKGNTYGLPTAPRYVYQAATSGPAYSGPPVPQQFAGPVGFQNSAETEGLIGFFVNTLVLRTDLSGEPTVSELLRRVREVCLSAYARQDLPFEKLVEELQPDRDLGRTPLFQAMLVLQNAPGERPRLEGLELEELRVETRTAKFELTLSLSETDRGLVGLVEYNTDLFVAETIRRMTAHCERLLKGIVEAPASSVRELSLLTEEERHQLLVGFNETAREYPRHSNIQQLFEEQVERAPDAVAVVFQDKRISYRELNNRANGVARRLRALGVGPNSLVGVCLDRGIEMVVGLLGTLKSGGAYAPLDPLYPRERLSFMLEDSGVCVLLTQERWLGAFGDCDAEIILLDNEPQVIAGQETDNPVNQTTAENLAYIIYTSGSTGTPKGVQITHRGVLRLVCGGDYVRLDEQQMILQAAPLAFDASTFEIWGALLHGACCVLFDGLIPTAPALAEVIKRHGIRTMWLTSALFNSVIDEDVEALREVEQLLIGGEALSVTRVRRASSEFGKTRLINGYGPTESTTFTCCLDIKGVPEGAVSIPIGKPISNTQVYVLDESGQPAPIGVPGELYIGGDGLGQGYLNRPELTAAKFVPHPYSSQAGARLYRTGDRVRVLLDWNIEFLGRLDRQVKLRGFRIELGEIESVISRHPSIQDVVLRLREGADGVGDNYLVAYIIVRQGQSVTTSELRRYLRERLPEYMAPAWFVTLEEFRLTPNGKIDWKALPVPENAIVFDKYLAPVTPTEIALAQIWANLLKIDPNAISSTSNLFDLGGHSLLLVKLVAEVRNKFAVELPIKDVMGNPQLNLIAERIYEEGLKNALSIGSEYEVGSDEMEIRI